MIKITNSSDEVKSKTKTPAFVAVGIFQNTKDFEFTNDVFNSNTLAGEVTVSFFGVFA
jgi:hypothetical protein